MRLGDSGLNRGPTSGGSRTTATVVPAALAAATELRSKLARRLRGVAAPEGVRVGGRVIAWAEALVDGVHATSTRPPDNRGAARSAPAPFAGGGAVARAYAWMFRAISRTYAEWPLVEAVARLVFDGETIIDAAVAAGGVAPIPLRLRQVEDALIGRACTAETLSAAAARSDAGANPLPQTGFKRGPLVGTVGETLARAASRG